MVGRVCGVLDRCAGVFRVDSMTMTVMDGDEMSEKFDARGLWPRSI